MNKLNTILVGVDFSDCSRCALEQAARLARWNDASLSVIYVVNSSALDDSPPVPTLRHILWFASKLPTSRPAPGC